ncbi:hypothetical protein [Paraflavitalea speifideaquila]|uniref:hypothetical protein n=1 Tax=Paraflavitalea speifideaquila TaxID=3076558 RepID=UPI0028E7BBA6|nr:hypothetical protein [Paraflavitalea speifideiaquila]
MTVGSSPAAPAAYTKQVQASLVQAPFPYADQPGPVLTPGATIEKDYARKSAKLPDPPADKKAARKNLLRSHQAGTFALGFTLPLAFPWATNGPWGTTHGLAIIRYLTTCHHPIYSTISAVKPLYKQRPN